jgi:hypothetical protein
MAPSNNQKHQAGRDLAVAEALLRGYSVTIQGPQTFIQVNGRTATVMVAAQGAWMVADIDKFIAASTETYVLVNLTGDRRDCYVVPGDELRRGVAERHREFMKRVGGTRPRNPDSRQTAIEPLHVEAWQSRWSLFDQQEHSEGEGPGR